MSIESAPEIVVYAIGFLVLANIGTIIAVVSAIMRGVWWASKVDTTLGHLEKEIKESKKQNKEQLDHAHRNIRKNRDEIAGLACKINTNP